MRRSRRENRVESEIWPGFVDALSTLLLVTIFLLSVFVLAQFFLNQLLEGQDAQLERLQQDLAGINAALDDERSEVRSLRRNLSLLSEDLSGLRRERDDLANELAATSVARDSALSDLVRLRDTNLLLEDELALAADDAAAQAAREDALVAERDEAAQTIAEQTDTLVRLRQDIEALRTVRDGLEADVAAKIAELEALTERAEVSEAERERILAELSTVRDAATRLEAELAEGQERTLLVQTELDAETQAARAAREEVANLSELLTVTRADLARVEDLLSDRDSELTESETEIAELDSSLQAQSGEIADLEARLNEALAAQVDELRQFRSDFFGRLRQAIGGRQDVDVVGDRFVFQSEVLFDRGAADLGPEARVQLQQLATALSDIAAEIPDDLPWILQVDGHTDVTPISTFRFPSNWELSAARAIEVAQFLIDSGIPADRIAAAGFAEFQPLAEGEGDEALRRNRRIEIKLTNR